MAGPTWSAAATTPLCFALGVRARGVSQRDGKAASSRWGSGPQSMGIRAQQGATSGGQGPGGAPMPSGRKPQALQGLGIQQDNLVCYLLQPIGLPEASDFDVEAEILHGLHGVGKIAVA